MSFLAPAAFVLALLIPVIVVLYLLKLRRTEQVVSSTYLWRRMVRDLEANAPWQRLRRNLLLLLQLIVLVALILALARPFTWAEGLGGQAAILILDTSASMAATDVAPSRLEAAKVQALRWLEGLPDGTRVTVIAAGDGAQVLTSSSQDRRQVRLAVQAARVGQPGSGSDLSAALELAAAIAARQPDTETVVYSDGRVVLPEYTTVRGRVRHMPMGISGDNQAIGALTLQPGPGGGRTAFVQVTNYGQSPVQRRLVLSAFPVDGGNAQTLNAYDLDLLPGKPRVVVAEGLPSEVTAVEAQLLGADVLAADDRAWAVHSPGEPAQVTLVTEGNLFLETGLALLPSLEVTTVRPGDWETGRLEDGRTGGEAATGDQPSSLPAFQPSTLTIFDAYAPLTATLPSGNLFFIAPPRSTDLFSVTGRVEQPVPRAVSGGAAATERDALLAHVDVADVGVQYAMRVSLPAWARPVIVGDVAGDVDGAAMRSVPLLWAGEREGQRIAVLAFDLRRSDLALQVAFPLLLANLTGWLAPSGGSDLPPQVSPGRAVSFSLPPDVQEVRVTRPDGSQARAAVAEGQATWADTERLGVYRLRWGEGGQAAFAVNLFSPLESDLEPEGGLSLGEGEGGEGAADAARGTRREWWRLLALVALIVLFAEWLVYHRAEVVRLWARARATLANVVTRR